MKLRETHLNKLPETYFDVLIIGGGINGAVSAAALAGKGIKTALIDKNDFGSETSQESSNLVWGGIKYLETLEFSLVRNLCKSRNHLIKNYPSTVKEIRFFTTVTKGFRFHPVFLWLGTWLYWMIGGCKTKRPIYLFKSTIEREEKSINTQNISGGFEYSDAYLQDTDTRFVFNFIRSAISSGCIAANYVEAIQSTKIDSDYWLTTVKNTITGEEFSIKSKSLINAAGPYADQFNKLTKQITKHHLVLSKGIHLIVNRISQINKVLTFFASDGRLFFAIPLGTRTCIGSTDTVVKLPTKEITDEDREFVLNNANKLLNLEKPLEKKDIISERCGVRPLVIKGEMNNYDDWMQLSRKHKLEVNYKENYLTIFGGKLTDCINVGNEVSDIIKKMKIETPYPAYKWFGEPDNTLKECFFHNARLINLDNYTSPDSSEKLSTRLWRRYGLTAFSLLELIQEDPEQAEVLIKGTEYIRCELYEAAHREMITKLEDFIRRRSKIGLVEKKENMKNSDGLLEACKILFGDQAEQKMNEYFK